MKLTFRQTDCLTRQLQGSTLRVKLGFLLAVMVITWFLLSWNTTLCVYFQFLMWLRSDACKTWEDTGDVTRGDYTWWQRACLLERDWEKMDYLCRDLRLMGNWPVCFDDQYSPVKPSKPCVVYSFGIAYDFRFDDAMAIYNCTVYSFDPSMDVEDHRRGSNIYFKKLGIGAADDLNFIPRLDGYTKSADRWKIMTLSSIMKVLGHTPQSLSVIKLDVENNEWHVLKNLLDEGIIQQLPQVLIEWHIFSDSPPHGLYKDMHEDYTRFKMSGFEKFWMRSEGRNHWLPKMVTQTETAYINRKYKPPAT